MASFGRVLPLASARRCPRRDAFPESLVATLSALLRSAAAGHGGALLIGGESGVGKSRLLDEVRTQALVEGVIVVRGQGVSQVGGPYHVWRNVLRNLILRVDLSDGEASALKAVVPDIGDLLGLEIEDSLAFNAETTQSRLLLAVEEVLRRQGGTVLVILEDLQWVGSESLRLLDWLAQSAERLPLLLLGTFRNDEAPELPRAVESARVMALGRLARADIAALAEAMIGPGGCDADVATLLERETEGIPFFVVEVVRALAEQAGGLSRIARDRLPIRVVSGGMQRVVRRRLGQVQPEAIPPLETAAVLGRTLDLDLLRALHPDLRVDDWLVHCTSAAVLQLQDQRWQFVHDKLRDQLLDDLGAERRRALHRHVAEALERERASRAIPMATLAHHWNAAGDGSKERLYAEQAGVEALESGASREAVAYFTRVVELLDSEPPAGESASSRPRGRATRFDPNTTIDPDGHAFQRGAIETKLCEAYFRLGDIEACRAHGTRALALFGQGHPQSGLGWLVALLQQIALRSAQSLWPSRRRDVERARRIAPEVVRAHSRLVEASFYQLRLMPIVWSSLRVINHSEPAGPSPDLARGYYAIGILAALSHLGPLADRWEGRAVQIAEQTGSPYDVAWILSRISVAHLSLCKWEQSDAMIERAFQLADDLGDLRLWEECRHVTATGAMYRARYDRALTLYRSKHRSGRASGSRQTGSWDLIGQAEVLVRVGSHEEALRLTTEAAALLDEKALKSETIMALGASALASLGAGDRASAYQAGDHALALLGDNKPIAHWLLPPMAEIAEVGLASWEHSLAEGQSTDAIGAGAARSQRACAMLLRLARVIPIAAPSAFLWEGLRSWLAGRKRRAMRLWQRTLALAESADAPYEGARAHFEIGRHLSAGDPERSRHLRVALEAFERLGCVTNAATARAALAAPEAT